MDLATAAEESWVDGPVHPPNVPSTRLECGLPALQHEHPSSTGFCKDCERSPLPAVNAPWSRPPSRPRCPGPNGPVTPSLTTKVGSFVMSMGDGRAAVPSFEGEPLFPPPSPEKADGAKVWLWLFTV